MYKFTNQQIRNCLFFVSMFLYIHAVWNLGKHKIEKEKTVFILMIYTTKSVYNILPDNACLCYEYFSDAAADSKISRNF